MNDHTEQQRWEEELEQNPPECYHTWYDAGMPWWYWQNKDANWIKRVEESHGR